MSQNSEYMFQVANELSAKLGQANALITMLTEALEDINGAKNTTMLAQKVHYYEPSLEFAKNYLKNNGLGE